MSNEKNVLAIDEEGFDFEDDFAEEQLEMVLNVFQTQQQTALELTKLVVQNTAPEKLDEKKIHQIFLNAMSTAAEAFEKAMPNK